MQRARCYLLGESAVVLELEPPVTLASQQRIWGLADRLIHHPDVLEAIPGMNNLTLLLADPNNTALDAIERLQRWWEESESLVPESRDVTIPVIYGGDAGPDLAEVARHTGMTERQVVECHAGASYIVYFLGFQPGFPIWVACRNNWQHHGARSHVWLFPQVLSGLGAAKPVSIRWQRRVVGN